MLKALPTSQAGPHRHRCAYRAFQDGKKTGSLLAVDDGSEAADDAEEAKIASRTDIGPTQKEQLVLARRGQGIFRQNVSLLCKSCRLTGVADQRFLIAGHIKPWRDCSDKERLDGYNGLLLAPHADRLFDKGWITFSMAGEVVKSPHLPDAVWKAWRLDSYSTKTLFDGRYAAYLKYHRQEVFKT
jgi:predicted restriction endonuclease